MHFTIFFKIFVILAAFLIALAQGQALDPNFGAGDISKSLQNKDYVEKQLHCVLGKSECDNVGKQLKAAIPEVLQKDCKSCTSQQSANAKRLVSFIKKNYPAEWSDLTAKYNKKA